MRVVAADAAVSWLRCGRTPASCMWTGRWKAAPITCFVVAVTLQLPVRSPASQSHGHLLRRGHTGFPRTRFRVERSTAGGAAKISPCFGMLEVVDGHHQIVYGSAACALAVLLL